jgi:hypothetical protein
MLIKKAVKYSGRAVATRLAAASVGVMVKKINSIDSFLMLMIPP